MSVDKQVKYTKWASEQQQNSRLKTLGQKMSFWVTMKEFYINRSAVITAENTDLCQLQLLIIHGADPEIYS